MYQGPDRASRPTIRQPPGFRGTRDLKFTREDIAAIQAAEVQLGYTPRGSVNRTLVNNTAEGLGRAFRLLLLVAALAVAGELVIAVLSSPSAANTPRPTPPASIQVTSPVFTERTVPKATPPAFGAIRADGAAKASLAPAADPLPPGVKILWRPAPEPETRRPEVLVSARQPELQPQRALVAVIPSPSETQLVAPEAEQADLMTPAALLETSPAAGGAPLAPPVIEHPPVADGSWHSFRQTAPSRAPCAHFERGAPRWPRQPAPGRRVWRRVVVIVPGPMMPPGRFVIVSQPPLPRRLSYRRAPVASRQWGAGRR